jgi:hypothetical protein
VDGWLLHVRGAHPLWCYWMLAVIHLRPIASVRPPHVRFEGATHELMVVALDPNVPLPDLDAVGRGDASFQVLTPIDVCEQFAVQDDAQASQLCEMAVGVCVNGQASPDQDWRRWWTGAIAETAKHLREGKHPEARA